METIHGLNTNGPAIIGTGVVFTVLSVVAVGLRFISKRLTGAPHGADDWLLLAALLIYFVAEVLVIRSDVVGRQATSPDDPRYQRYLQYVYIYSIFYFPVIALAQGSILFLYRYLFYPSHLRYTSLILASICLAWLVAALVIEIGYPGHTIAYSFPGGATTHFNAVYFSFWLAMSIIEALLEITIMLLPFREIRRLQLSAHKKLLLSLIFSLGSFVVITAIIRMSVLYRPDKPDLDLTQGDIWLNVHLGTGIISACLPTFRPLISRSSGFLRSFHTRQGSYAKDTGSLPSAAKKSRIRNQESMEGIVLEPRQEGKASWADARWSEGSNTPTAGWQEDGPVRTGEAIGVRRTVEVV